LSECLLLIGLASLLQLEEDAGDAGDDSEEAHCALVDLRPHNDFRHVGPGHCGHEVAHQVDELNGYELPLFVDFVESFQELHGSHLLQLLFQLGFLTEAVPEHDGHRNDLPNYSEQED
jgi:hypothetical protein